jgi:tetratricopeptide (TPR) repeat protein
MLGTLRDFAAEKLAECGEAREAAMAHIDFLLPIARSAAEPPRETADEVRDRACIEIHNMLEALAAAVEHGRSDAVGPLCDVLHDEDIVDPGRAAEIRHNVSRIWAAARESSDTATAARLGHLALHVHWKAWDHRTALTLADEAMRLAEAAGDRELCWDVAVTAASAAAGGRREDAIREWLRVASPYARDAAAHSHLIMFIAGLGRHAEAAEAAEELLASLSPDETPEGKHLAYHAAAVVRMRMGQFEEASEAGETALQIIREHFSADREMCTAAPPVYVPAFARAGRLELAETVIADVTRRLEGAPPALVVEKAAGMVAFCNLAEMWEEAARIADTHLSPFPPETLPEAPLPDAAGYVAEAWARAGRAEDARATLEPLLSADRAWDEEMGYFIGQNVKAMAEVLRATDNLRLAVTVAELARRAQQSQPALQLTCRELLELLASEMPEAAYAEALAAAEGMKPSEAVALTREALGV